jgi:diadenosine tetraphosphate (Ap4A) HIT family hydrolase
MSTLFERILSGELKSWKVWEDNDYLAFLTPFPNTIGVTVVIPKSDVGNYVFDLKENDYQGLLGAARTVAKILEKAFGVSRVALVFEGTGVACVHAKLYPLHGNLADETNIWSKHFEFHPEYLGYITTVEGPKASDEELNRVQERILNIQEK